MHSRSVINLCSNEERLCQTFVVGFIIVALNVFVVVVVVSDGEGVTALDGVGIIDYEIKFFSFIL